MKIAIFTDTFFPTMNGVVTSTNSFCKELANRGNEIIIICPYNQGIERYNHNNINVISIKGINALIYPEFKLVMGASLKIYRIIKKFNPDIIHFQTQFKLGLYALRMGRIFRKPVIGTFHTYIADEGYLKILGLDKFRFLNKLTWEYNNYFYKKCQLVITPSNNSMNQLVNNGLINKNIKVVPNPVPFVEKSEKEKYNYLEGINCENILLYVGRISEEKNLNTAVKAIKIVKTTINDIKFIIIGKGPAENDIKNLVKEEGLTNTVIFLGAIEHEKLFKTDLFKRSKLFITASGSETQGISLIEAMFNGLPVIGVDRNGTGELIQHGFNGLKSNFGDYYGMANNIIYCLKNKEETQKMSQNAFDSSKKFDLKKTTDILEKIYMETISNFGK